MYFWSSLKLYYLTGDNLSLVGLIFDGLIFEGLIKVDAVFVSLFSISDFVFLLKFYGI